MTILKIGFQKDVSPRLALYGGISKETDALKMAAIENGGGSAIVAGFVASNFINTVSVLYTPREESLTLNIINETSNDTLDYNNSYEDYTWAVELTAHFTNCFIPNESLTESPGFANMFLYEFDEDTYVKLSPLRFPPFFLFALLFTLMRIRLIGSKKNCRVLDFTSGMPWLCSIVFRAPRMVRSSYFRQRNL